MISFSDIWKEDVKSSITLIKPSSEYFSWSIFSFDNVIWFELRIVGNCNNCNSSSIVIFLISKVEISVDFLNKGFL